MAIRQSRRIERTAPRDQQFLSSDEMRGHATTLLRDRVSEADADGVIVALSGGVDSSTTAALAAEALGTDRVSGLLMPTDENRPANTRDARRLASDLGIDYVHVNVNPLVSEIRKRLPTHVTRTAGARETGNLVARVRMACAYYAANSMSRLVLGTTNRTERLLGCFTKYGDGGVDLQPLGNLYRTEVRALARYLELPETIIDQPATTGFGVGGTDEFDLGAPYGSLDEVLSCLVDGDFGMHRTATELDLDIETVKQYAEWHINTRHKRLTPPTTGTHAPAGRSRYSHEVELRFH